MKGIVGGADDAVESTSSDSAVVKAAAVAAVVEEAPKANRPVGVKKRSVERGPFARDWVFTINNPSAEVKPLEWDGVKFIVFQKERGENGTEHYQGFVQFHTKKRVTALKKLNGRAHWEPRRGSVEEAAEYCQKVESRIGGPWTRGEMSRQGGRADLAALARRVLTGTPLSQIARDDGENFIRYSRGLQALSCYAPAPPIVRGSVEVWLFYGPTGVGKTWKAVHSVEDQQDIYMKDTGPWWDNYCGQPVVVMDDFAGKASQIKLAEVLRMLDRYRYQVPVKGSYEWLMVQRLIVTTNIHPHEWYNWEGREDQYPALMRRFTKIVVFTRDGESEVSLADFVGSRVNLGGI